MSNPATGQFGYKQRKLDEATKPMLTKRQKQRKFIEQLKELDELERKLREL